MGVGALLKNLELHAETIRTPWLVCKAEDGCDQLEYMTFLACGRTTFFLVSGNLVLISIMPTDY